MLSTQGRILRHHQDKVGYQPQVEMGLMAVATGSGIAAWEKTACILPRPPAPISTQGSIQRHHQGKAGHQAKGGVGLVAVAVGFGDHLVGDHEQHGAGREP